MGKPPQGQVRSRRANAPPDGPLLSIEEAAAYLRLSPGAVAKMLGGRADGDDGELGRVLRDCLVCLSPRRRYIAKQSFLAWLNAAANRSPAGASGQTAKIPPDMRVASPP